MPPTDVESSSFDDERVFSNHRALLGELRRRRKGDENSVYVDIHYSSMEKSMETFACVAGAKAMKAFHTDRQIAQYIKEHFDREYGKAWQCICGRHFGSFVTFEPESFIYFRIGARAFMLFRSIEVKTVVPPIV